MAADLPCRDWRRRRFLVRARLVSPAHSGLEWNSRVARAAPREEERDYRRDFFRVRLESRSVAEQRAAYWAPARRPDPQGSRLALA